MSYIKLNRWPSQLSEWFLRSPNLAVELELTFEPTSCGEIAESLLTPAGKLLFTEFWPKIGTVNTKDREVRAWMMVEEGWSADSFFEGCWDEETRLYYPAPLKPSICRVITRYFAAAGVVRHRTASAFLSELPHFHRDIVVLDPTPVINLPHGEGGTIRAPRAPFHPFIRWRLA